MIIAKNKPFVPSIDQQKMYERVCSMLPGESVSYQAFSEIIGRDVRTCQWLLARARRRAQIDHEIVTDAGDGRIRRRTNEEIPARGREAIGKAHRAALRGARTVRCAEYATLSIQGKTEHNLTISVCATLAHLTKPKKLKQLEQKTASSERVISVEATLRLFSPKTKEKKP